jgi:5,6,7,8-tetrahydromethanopterin hydro-lyase
MELGEAFAGDGANAAHVNTVLGERDGPVGAAWASALASPSQGHTPFVVVAQPNLPVQPFTLFVNKAAIAGDDHARLTWGAAQAGVAQGVLDAVASGVLGDADPARLVVIAAVWVNPAADDDAMVFANNARATTEALQRGRRREPGVDEALSARGSVWNPFFRP